MTGFDLNEDLKERCILLGVTVCYTQFVKEDKKLGVPSYWFNKIMLPLTMSKPYTIVVCGLIDDYLDEMRHLDVGFITTEVKSTSKGKYVYYCIFADKKSFMEKTLF